MFMLCLLVMRNLHFFTLGVNKFFVIIVAEAVCCQRFFCYYRDVDSNVCVVLFANASLKHTAEVSVTR